MLQTTKISSHLSRNHSVTFLRAALRSRRPMEPTIRIATRGYCEKGRTWKVHQDETLA